MKARLVPTRDEIVDAVAIAALCAVALVGFRSSYGGVEFLVVGVVGVLLATVVAHVLVGLHAPALVSVAALAVVYVVFGGAVALRDRTIAGFLPTPDSVIGASRAVVVGWKDLITTNPPVAGVGVLMVLPFLGGFAAAATSIFLARRRLVGPVLVPTMLLLALTIATGTDDPVSTVVQGSLFAVIAIAWMSHRQHEQAIQIAGTRRRGRRIEALALLAFAALGGWFVAPALPGADRTDRATWRATVTPPFDPRTFASPLSGYRLYLDERVAQRTMFTIDGLSEPSFVRLASLDQYDGLVWRPSFTADEPTVLNSGYFERMGSSIEPDVPGATATITVTIADYSDVWIPVVGEVLSLRFDGGPRDRLLNDVFRYNRATDTAVSAVPLQTGDRYVMEVRLPAAPDPDRPQTLEGASFLLDEFVPDVQPIEAVDAWVNAKGTIAIDDPGAQIDALVAIMREEGTYSDGDTDRNQLASAAGHSVYRLTSFVQPEPLIGNAEQYASSLALAVRTLTGVPTRVGVGFHVEEVGDGGAVEVIAERAEAWMEVPIAEQGWSVVTPTPDRDQIAVQTRGSSEPEPDYDTQIPPPPPLVEPTFDEPATTRSAAEDTTEPESDETVDDESDDRVDSRIATWVIVAGGVAAAPVVLFLVVLVAITLLKRRRRSRRRRRGEPHERFANGWAELVDTAIDLGRAVPDTATRREAAQFVGSGTTALASRADAAVFGPTQLADDDVDRYWNDIVGTLKGMSREVGPIDRAKARLSISSFAYRRRRHRDTEGAEP